MPNKDIVVIGGSAGSHSVVKQIVSQLPENFPAAAFVVTHMPSDSYLSESLQGRTRLPVVRAVDGQPIEHGRVYVAVPNSHLLLLDGVIGLGSGPRENLTRPAIDPLFRSAAISYGSRVIGVVLSGMLNDGAAGLAAVKQCGGTAVVQNPLDAQSNEMPIAALEAVQPDHVVAGADVAPLLVELVQEEAQTAVAPPAGLRLEVQIAAGSRLGSDTLRKIANPSPLSCPECGGVLSEVRGEPPLRYRCQIGHGFTAEVLAAETGKVDEAMVVALRIMEERVTLVRRMAEEARSRGRTAIAEIHESRAEEYASYATVLRQALTTSSDGEQPEAA
jgi:two-component system chemotaxis response regulator CheB